MSPNAPDTIEGPKSAEELVRLYDRLSIPHFQRGLVWESRSVALLLESLYLDTPCGAVILWSAPEPAKQGVPLGKSPQYLIVDGQQRIRSLQGVLNEDSENGDAEDAGDGEEVDYQEADQEPLVENGRRVWCLNLGQLPELQNLFPGGRRHRLFRQARDPRTYEQGLDGAAVHGAPLQDREALLPLQWFLQNSSSDVRALVQGEPDLALAAAATAVLDNPEVNARLRGMLKRKAFQVSVVGRHRSLEDVVGIYNRINSAGKRVEAEERAFASLVAAYGGAHSHLKEFFEVVHPGREASSRDTLLERQKEGRFGFKLFMRAFAIGLAYHSNRSIGSSTFSFEAVSPDTLSKAGPHLPKILNESIAVSSAVANILRSGLHCDDFRFLPDTSALWPVFQLLTRFPELAATANSRLGSIALRLVLADPVKKDVLGLCTALGRARSVGEALSLFDNHPRLKQSAIEKSIKNGVNRAKSLTNRFTLVLYWLLRKDGARDFVYDQNVEALAAIALRKMYGETEPMLREELRPERQHIVPYKRLKALYRLEGGARPGRHDAHDIGNLTYISSGLNGLSIGMGSRPLRLEAEEHGNLAAHVLSEELLAPYGSLCGVDLDIATNSNRRKLLRSYEQFCGSRRRLIQSRLTEWDRELRAASANLDTECEPTLRLISPQVDDSIRVLGYSPDICAGLVALCIGGSSDKPKQGADLSVPFRRKKEGGQVIQVLRIDLYKDGNSIGLKLREDLRARFARQYPQLLPPSQKGKVLLATGELDAPNVLGILHWLRQEISDMVSGEAE